MSISVEPFNNVAAREASVVQLPQIIKVLRRHVLLIGACTVLAAAGAFFYASGVPKTYTATGSITVEGAHFAIPELRGALRDENSPDPMPFVRTEVQALTSRTLVQNVITKLNLEQDPEFNPALRPPTFVDQVKAAIKSLLPEHSAPGQPAGPDESVLIAVQKALSIFQDNRSLVISTAFTAQDPRLAAKFLNTLTNDYIQSRGDVRADATRSADTTLTQRISEARAGLDAIEQQMRELRSRGDIVALRAGSVGQQQVEELGTAAARASVDRAQLEASYARATALTHQGSSDALTGVLDSPTISRLRDQETAASSKVAQLLSHYGANYPGVRSAMADLAAVRAQIAGESGRIMTSLGAQLKVARDKEADLQRQLAAARTVSVEGENAHAQLDALQQEANTRRALYSTLLERKQQTVAQPASAQTPDVRVLSEAVPPGAPSGPNTKVIVGMGGLSGAVLGCLLALLRIGSVDGFDNAAAVTRDTGLDVLGTVRRTSRRGMADRVLLAPKGPEADAMRALRSRLRFAQRAATPRCVLFASALPGWDAAEFATAFARTAAANGEHILLVEANMAAPSLHRLLRVQSAGLSEVLQGGTDWRDATRADANSAVDVLVQDRKTPESSVLLSSAALQNLVVEARQLYDLVVMVGPAADAADVAVLGARADTTVLLLGARSGGTVRRALARLRQYGVSNATAVLVA